jgi:methionine-gamma-lyase
MADRKSSWATQVTHSAPHDSEYGAFAVPIYHTSTYEFANCEIAADRFGGRDPGYFYSRMGNPTVCSLEEKVASLEGSEDGVATSSGIAAVSCLAFTFLNDGQHILVDSRVNYAIIDFFLSLSKFGITTTVEYFTNIDAFRAALRSNTRLVFFATPAPPTMTVLDIRKISEEAHTQDGVLVAVENSFGTPLVTRPLELGADLVYTDLNGVLTGHGDIQGGVVAGSKALIRALKDTGVKEMIGCVMSPHDAYLAIRGLLTLETRLRTATENAGQIAAWLESNPGVSMVFYPGLESNPGSLLAQTQMGGFGNMVGFLLKGSLEQVKVFLSALELIQYSDQVGTVQTMILQPGSLVDLPRFVNGHDASLGKGLLVLSVGLEAPGDIIADLEKGINSLLAQ